MRTQADLLDMRKKLHDRLAVETYRLTAFNDDRLSKIAGILAGIEAIGLMLEQDIDRPDNGLAGHVIHLF